MMLSIRDLNFRYPGASADALEQVSLSAARGEVLGLLGPNGAGKTTLIAQLVGMLAMQRGEIEIDGQPLEQLRLTRPTCIAIAPQEYAFYPTLSVLENLDCFAGVGGLRGSEKAERIDACIALAQLQNYRKVQGQRLSGGLKRRLNMAIAMLHRPELVLFDEPTVGVDPQSRAFLLEAVKQLAREGSAVIYTSHYMEEVQAIADRIVVLDQGRVLCQGTLQDLLVGAATLYVEVDDDTAQERLVPLLSGFGPTNVQGRGALLAIADPEQLPEVLRSIAGTGLRLRQARYGQTDLEQLFMSLTHRSLRD
ncbi:ABC transporter ATP-binding protein [Rhodoferax saidenbachensis]|uniref:ABC-2 type transport system ATP-binding protein n=1 Tax=Rhodoferax saidenbachensis TaxID=1484693 RepID=A0ABU1ZKJ9_9BURK|nr:ABC transporter ATP-binding protein [Rhodoferax saidenbachensis]MDR7306080.1 ABC-2 type transport system ATP-binding protein [Rhodoferax saidenbachensis]